MAKLMVHRDLLKGFGKLPSKVQKRIAEFVERFQENAHDPALHVHSLKGDMVDPKVRGAHLPDGYRAILVAPEQGDTFLLMHVDKHDDAYAWAKNKRFEVHEKTGLFQVFDVEETERAVEATQTEKTSYPLNRFSEQDLFRAGVPRALIPSVRAIQSDEALDALSDYLPGDCRDVLYGMAAGLSLDAALEEMLGVFPTEETSVAGPGDFTDLEERQSVDLVLVEGEEELRRILKGSLEAWRIFLHPYQRRLVEWDVRGPMNVTGAAGTGKTVVLLHRAVHLARNLRKLEDRILLTTFTSNLVVTLRSQLRSLDKACSERIDVTHLHALARKLCVESGWKGRIAEDDDLQDLWSSVWRDEALGEPPLSREEMEREYDLVVDSHGIEEEEEYLTTVRSGRPRMSREKRRKAWPFFRAFQRGLKKRGLLSFEGAVHEARLAAEERAEQRYAHVLVDEVQDFSLEALRLIRALSPVEEKGNLRPVQHEGTRNPLTLAGDGHQRIYRRKIPLSWAGIDVRGRSQRLKINYRTTEEIRKYAQGLLEGVDVDNFEGGQASTVADHSLMKGRPPLVKRCRDPRTEARTVCDWVKGLLEVDGFATHEICITPRRPHLIQALEAAGIPTFELKPRQEDPGSQQPGVRMGTMRRIKGLEFKAVAMVCVEEGGDRGREKAGEERGSDERALARCLQYVAATRARERLLVVLCQFSRA